MSRVPVLARLVWRPVTLWNVAIVVTIGLLATAAAPLLLADVFRLDRKFAFIGLWPTAAFVGSAAIGALLAWAAYEALLSPLALTLPRCAARLRNELLVVGAFVPIGVGAAMLWLIGWPSTEPIEHSGGVWLIAGPMASIAAIGYGAAVFASDPQRRVARGTGLLPLAGVFLLAVLAPVAYVVLQAGATGAVGMVALIVAGGILASRPFTADRVRTRALLPTSRIGLAYRTPDLRDGVYGAASPALTDRRWLRAVRTDSDRALATLHEVHGGHPGGWIGSTLVQALLWTAVAIGLALLVQRGLAKPPAMARIANDLRGTAGNFHRLTAAGIVIPIWFGMAALMAPLVPLSTFVRPISRASRARAAWLATAATTGTLLVALAVLLSIVAQVAVAHAPAADRTPGLPEWSRVLLGLAIIAPIAHWARLQFVDSRPKSPSPLVQGVVAGLVVTGLMALCAYLAGGWRAIEHLPWFAQLALATPAIVATWSLWHAFLGWHFRRADLRV